MKSVPPILRYLIVLFVTALFLSTPGHAKNKKFVYVYNSDGVLVKPINAASKCPNPDEDSGEASICYGVEVDDNGKYSCRFDSSNIDTSNLVFVANEYDYIKSGDKGTTKDTYVFLGSKRRVDNVTKNVTNKGVDINRISEATVKALEKSKKIPKGKRGSVHSHLSKAAKKINAKKVNRAMGNDNDDNDPDASDGEDDRDRSANNQRKMDADDEDDLVEIATVVLENEDNADVQDYVRKNVKQILADPAGIDYIKQRVFSHLSAVQAGDTGLVFLEADKYRVLENEIAQLTTINSINPEQFFAYTWGGVSSTASTATFSNAVKGSYTVCATGEISGGSDSSTDCIRMAVKDIVDAVARAGSHRVGTGNTIKLSASLSVGATSYLWSGVGVFATESAEVSLWTAPEEPGTYELTLDINSAADSDSVVIEVFDVVPVAIAAADQYIVLLDEGQASVSLVSGSISTDGSDVDALLWEVTAAPSGSTFSFSDSSGASSSFTANAPGEYSIQLTATKRGFTDVAELNIRVREPNAPIAIAGADITIYRNQSVRLDASESSASQGKALSYLWSADGGTVTNTNNASANFVSNVTGEFKIDLLVTEGGMSSTDLLTVTVKNRLPTATDAAVTHSMTAVYEGQLTAADLDSDTLEYTLVTAPGRGGVTVDEATGSFNYIPGGMKACKFSPYMQPDSNGSGGNSVPVIKLCADKTTAAAGETITLTTSNSINASKFSGFDWNVIVTQVDLTTATFTSSTAGTHHICITGNIGQSNNTSTACIDVEVDPSLTTGDAECRIEKEDYGLLDGHFDVDTSNFLSQINDGATSKHTHEYDDQYDVTGVDGMSIHNRHMDMLDAIDPDQKFKLIVINADLSTGARLSINQVYDHKSSSSYEMATSYDDTALADLPTYSLSGVAGSTKLSNFEVHFDKRAISQKGLHPTNTGPVRKNIPGAFNEWRNGSFVVQAVAVNDNGSDNFDTDLSKSNGGVHGVAIDGMLWELTMFWHWDGPDYHNAGWSTYEPHGELNEDGDDNWNHSGQCGSVEQGYEDSFQFRVNDGLGNSNIATVRFNMEWSNRSPEADDLNISITEDTASNSDLNAIDADSNILTYSIVDNGSLGTVVITDASTGAFTYTPNSNAAGVDTITYSVNDGFQGVDTGVITITINNVNDYPVAYFAGSVSTDEEVAVGGTLTGTDPDPADVLEYRLVTIPAKGSVVLNDSATGTFTYTPDEDLNGADSFYFLVNDGQVDSNTARVDINIAAVNDAPVAVNYGSFSVRADEKISKTLAATDVDKDALVYKVISNPSLGTVALDASTGEYVYTPSGTLGPDSFTYNADDGTVTSNTATVTIEVTAANIAPVANSKSITVFESVKYANLLTGSDAESSDLTFSIVDNGRLGQAKIENASTGTFSYTPNALASGGDFFTFKVNDGDKDSQYATVNVNIIPSVVSCSGPGNNKADADNDGYADYVELAFGTDVNDSASTPAGLNPADYGVSFTDDDDSDNYSDISELWLKTNHRSDSSKPNDSTLNGVPACLTAINDNQAPALDGFTILTPTVDMGAGDTVARFALSVIDNAAGVKTVKIKLTSPSGAEIEGTVTPSGSPVVYYGDLSTNTFNYYAEQGTWTIAELTLTDARNNEVVLGTADLSSRNYATTINLINPNSDIEKPVLSDFVVVTPSLDVSGGTSVATFNVTTTDNLAGIARTAVTLQSPSGLSYRFGEVLRSDNATSVTETINTDAFEIFAEAGTWLVTELLISDEAGNTLILNGSALTGLSFAIEVEVTGPVPDTTGATLIDITLLTPEIDASTGDARAAFRIQASDPSGISELTLVLQGPTGGFGTVYWSSLTPVTSLDTIVYSFTFPRFAVPGPCVYYNFSLVDGAGNVNTWNTAQLITFGVTTSFLVRNPLYGIGSAANSLPIANPTSFQTDEDTLYPGTLSATDSDGDTLTYSIVTGTANGSVSFTNVNSGAFNYTPKENYYGNDYFTFKVDDGTDESNTALVSITVNPTADPTTGNDTTIQVIKDELYTGNLNATDPDGLTLTYTILSNGTLGNASLTNVNTGAIVYEPNAGTTGADSFTYQVGDSNSTSSPITVNVSIVPDMALSGFDVQTPVVSGLDEFVNLSAAITLTKDISQITDARISLEGPSAQIVSLQWTKQAGATYPFTISKNHYTVTEPLEAGTWTFKDLLVKRLAASVYEEVEANIVAAGFSATIDVRANTSPTANRDDAYTTSLGVAKQASMTATDPEGDSLTYSILTGPGLGSIELLDASTGSFRYTPTSVGTDIFTFKVNDGLEDSGEGLVTITVNALNGVPVAYNSSIDVTENIAYIGSMNATDPEGDSLTYSVASQPGIGSLEMTNAATGAYVYRPNADTTGSDSFTFTVNDGSDDSNTATVTVTVAVPNSKPVLTAASITVFENVVYNGSLSATDADGDSLSYYLMSNGVLGSISMTASTGAYTYSPVTDIVGSDSFSVRAFDGELYSDTVTITVNVISKEQACGTGGVYSGLDTDGDGYIDAVELAFATDINDAASTPAGLSASDLGIVFTDDDDVDSYKDYIEVWMGSDPRDVSSVPQYVLDACFNALDDGIKPRLIGFDVVTPTIDIAGGDSSVSIALSLLDNASGVKRARVKLLSPSGVFVTSSATFTDYPLLTGIQIDSVSLGDYAEQGTWQVSGITLFDEAGNRLDLESADLTDAGYDIDIVVTNSNDDTTPPGIDNFVITSTTVYPGTASDRMKVDVTLTDSESGISSVRIDFISASGTVVTASQTITGSPTTSTLVQLDTGTLSQYLESGTWTVFGLLLVDSAGNSIQMADQLSGLGYIDALTVTNPLSDTTAPTLNGLSVLTNDVYPATTTARMSFNVSASDDAAGIEKIRIDITGPSGQVLTAWGVYTDSFPTSTTVQVDTAVLSTLTELGAWQITSMEILDDAGNSTTYTQAELVEQGYSTSLTVTN